MSAKHYNVKIEVTNPDGMAHTINVPTSAPSANHAKGAAQYTTQLAHPYCRTSVVDCYEVSDKFLTPVSLRAVGS